MRHLLFHMPAWMVGLVAAAFVAQIVLQFEIAKKWRAPALAGALAVVLAGTVWHWHATLPVYAYGVMLATAAVVAISIGVARAPVTGLKPVDMVDFGLYAVLWGVIGARAFHVFENHGDYFGGSRGVLGALAVWNGGLVFYGGMLGAMGYSAYYAFRREDGPRTLLKIFDLGAPCMMFGLAFGRIGCFLNGCCYGAPTNLPWGVQFPQGSPLWGAIWAPGTRSNVWQPLMDEVAQGVPPGGGVLDWSLPQLGLLQEVARRDGERPPAPHVPGRPVHTRGMDPRRHAEDRAAQSHNLAAREPRWFRGGPRLGGHPHPREAPRGHRGRDNRKLSPLPSRRMPPLRPPSDLLFRVKFPCAPGGVGYIALRAPHFGRRRKSPLPLEASIPSCPTGLVARPEGPSSPSCARVGFSCSCRQDTPAEGGSRPRVSGQTGRSHG